MQDKPTDHKEYRAMLDEKLFWQSRHRDCANIFKIAEIDEKMKKYLDKHNK